MQYTITQQTHTHTHGLLKQVLVHSSSYPNSPQRTKWHVPGVGGWGQHALTKTGQVAKLNNNVAVDHSSCPAAWQHPYTHFVGGGDGCRVVRNKRGRPPSFAKALHTYQVASRAECLQAASKGFSSWLGGGCGPCSSWHAAMLGVPCDGTHTPAPNHCS